MKIQNDGFSLLELMVVLFLIGILSTTALLYLKPKNIVLSEANYLQLFIQKVRNEAILQNMPYALELARTEITVWEWSGEAWIASSLNSHLFNEEKISVINERPVEQISLKKETSQVIIFSDGTLTPFKWRIQAMDQTYSALMITGNVLGKISFNPVKK